MPTLYLTRGLPGAGKTTWAREQLAAAEPGSMVAVSRDLVGVMLHGRRLYTRATEDQITTTQHSIVEQHLRRGVSVIVDDTNLRSSTLRKLADIGWRLGAEVEFVDFDVPAEECIARDAHRPSPVGEDVIRGMARRYLSRSGWPAKPERPEVPKGLLYVPGPTLPKAVMVDVDGTVALHVTRDPYDTSRYHEDAPNWPVIVAVEAMYRAGHALVFCSGRDEEFRSVTEQWIERYVAGADQFELHMRPRGDKRRDDAVKLELFDTHIRNRWNVVAAWDDRDRVIAAYRGIGLAVFQVNYGNF